VKRKAAILGGLLVSAAIFAVAVTRLILPACMPIDPEGSIARAPGRAAGVARAQAPPPEGSAGAGADRPEPPATEETEADPAAEEVEPRRTARHRAAARRSGGDRGRGEGADGHPDDGIEAVGQRSFVIASGAIERALEDGTATGGASAVPYQRGGEVVGFRLEGVSGMLARIGLRSGDVLTAVNGHAVDSPDAALDALARFRNARRIRLTVVRGGAPVGLDYRIE